MSKSYLIKLFLFAFLIYTSFSFAFAPAGDSKTLQSEALIRRQIKMYLNRSSEFLYKPQSFKIDMDSAKANVNKAFALSIKIKDQDLLYKCYVNYGEISFEENNDRKAIQNFEKAIKYYQATKQYKEEAGLWEILAKRFFWESPRTFETLEKAVNAFDKAIRIYRNLGLQENLAYVLKHKADAHLNQGKLDLAEKELLEVLALYKKIGFKKLHFTYDLLADLYRLKGDFGKSLYYSKLCVESMEKTNDLSYAPSFYEQLAIAYRDLGKHKKSIELLNKAIAIQKEQKIIDHSVLYELADLLCRELIQIHKPKEALYEVRKIINEYKPKSIDDQARIAGSLAYCYNENGQTELAETNFKKMIYYYEKSPQKLYAIQLSEAYFGFGKFYLEHENYDKAKINFEKSLNFSKGIVELSQIKESNLYLFKIDSVKGNYITAIKYFQKFKDLNDSIVNEKKNKQIEELQILYGLEKKEKDFSNLKLAMHAEKGKTNQAQNTIKFGLCIVLFLFLSTVLFWRSYKSKKKNNTLLIAQKNEIDQKNAALQKLVNEKESLMQEIHHRVKNNLQIVMSLLNSQSSTLKSEEAFDAIQKSQHRLYAISLLHQKLYRTDIVREIEMQSYISDLLANFADTFDLHNRINFKTDIQAIVLDEAQAVSVGLILNEAITNSIKYGFPENKKGDIFITMKNQAMNFVKLRITDNGVGFSGNVNPETSTTMGLSLINGLGEQLNGQVSITNTNGVTIEVVFLRNEISKT